MHRSDRHALLVLALLSASLAFNSVIGLVSRYYPAANPPAFSSNVIGQHEEGSVPVGGEDGHVLGDSLAQWIMAVFTIAGTVISVVAVRLVNDTLKTNKAATNAATEANRTARDIGTAQVRAYVGLVGLQGTTNLDGRPSIELSLSMNNAGTTPARRVSYRVWMVRVDEAGRRVLTHGSRTVDDPTDLIPGENRFIFRERYEFFETVGKEGKNAESLQSYTEGRTHYFLEGHIRYWAVMGDFARQTNFNYRITGWDIRGQVPLTFSREIEGNSYT